MKKLILLTLVLCSCQPHPRDQPHKHLISVNRSTYVETFYITSEIVLKEGCATFTYIDNFDFEGELTSTLCGSFEIVY